MTVKVEGDIFDWVDDRDKLLALLFLFNVVLYKKRHDLVITDAEALDSDAFKQLPSSMQSVIKESWIYSTTRSIKEVDCSVASRGGDETVNRIFSLEEAIRYLLQPLSVIVENSLNDGHFLLAVFRCFDESQRLIDGYREGWLQFENAGGCGNVRNFLEARRQFFGGKLKFLRCFVLLDGDKRFPNEVVGKYNKLIGMLTEWRIPYHILEKRCIENYLPDEAMKRSFDNKRNREWINAYMSLSEVQKDYFCVAEGFQKELTKEDKRAIERKKKSAAYKKNPNPPSLVRIFMPNDLREFYKDVSDGNFKHLEQGLVLKGDFKDTYPLAFENSNWIYRKSLEQRTSHQKEPDELQTISDRILRLL